MTSNAVSQDQTPVLPEWIRVLPRGAVELSDHREPFMVDKASLLSMAADFRSRGVDLVIDYEHQSLQGERAPAAGWIKDLEARDDGLWARVDWTQQARDYLEKKEYRYFSPVLRLDPATRRPLALLHVGLTNVPAIKHLPPLVARWGGAAPPGEPRPAEPVVRALAAKMDSVKEKGKMVEQLKRLMGLEPEVEEGAVCGKALEAFRDLASTLNLPGEVSVAQLKGAVEALKAGAIAPGQGRGGTAGPQSPPGEGDGRPVRGGGFAGREGQPGPTRLGAGILSPGPGRFPDLCGPGPETGAHRGGTADPQGGSS